MYFLIVNQSQATVQSYHPRNVTSFGVTQNSARKVRFSTVILAGLSFLDVSKGVCVLLVELHPALHLARRSAFPSPVAPWSSSIFSEGALPQSVTQANQLRNAQGRVMQEGETCNMSSSDAHPSTCPHTVPSQGILGRSSGIFLYQELALPGREAQEMSFYLARRMYLPFRSRLLLKWMENQRNEVRTIP